MGAVASGGVTVINDDVACGLGISPEGIGQVAEREGRELLRREQAYREGRPFPEVAGKLVIVVDDGLATGSSMRAAVEAPQRLRPAAIVVAVPAAPEATCWELNALADRVVGATTPSPFFAVGESHWDFTQTTDEEVRDLLRAAPGSRPAAAGGAGSRRSAGRRHPVTRGGRALRHQRKETAAHDHRQPIGSDRRGTDRSRGAVRLDRRPRSRRR
jgi:predicted phosphoribosyltransferase